MEGIKSGNAASEAEIAKVSRHYEIKFFLGIAQGFLVASCKVELPESFGAQRESFD